MEYMSCPETAKKWGISERRVQKLCEENRIPGVSKIGYMWLIPKNAEKPKDNRRKASTQENLNLPLWKSYEKFSSYLLSYK